jgi:hypothetical protein
MTWQQLSALANEGSVEIRDQLKISVGGQGGRRSVCFDYKGHGAPRQLHTRTDAIRLEFVDEGEHNASVGNGQRNFDVHGHS